jgi:hypothetical protein
MNKLDQPKKVLCIQMISKCGVVGNLCGLGMVRVREKEKEYHQFFERVYPFYLPHMEYEGSIGFVMRKMKNFYC